ncbi:MAG: sugar-binding protein [Planctomycetota bacterium]|jgi:ribose transport system substrate-binding protein
MLRRTSLVCLLALAAGLLWSCGNEPAAANSGKPRVAFVTNCAVEFWAVAEAGVKAAAEQAGVEALVRMPPTGTAEEQKRYLEDLVAAGVKGIAVTPKDPDNMTGLLDRIAERCTLITHDSDAPKSKRLCYIGVDNYDAGRMCGQLVEEAMPDGGPIVILVGTLDQDNARGRRQGLIDHLLGRSHDPSRFDPQDAVLKNDKWEIRATFTSQMDPQKAKAAAQDSLTRWSDLRGMVGLFAYEPPVILDAVKSANRLDQIAIVGFDEDAATLKGIRDGEIHGTVVQNPYEYGHRSITLLAKLLAAEDEAARKALLPESGTIVVPARQIRKANVQAFWDDLNQKLGK